MILHSDTDFIAIDSTDISSEGIIWTRTLKKDTDVLNKQESRLFTTNLHTSGSGEETGPMTDFLPYLH